MKLKRLLVAATVTAGVWFVPPAWADPFFFSTGSADGLLGAFSQPASTVSLDTETADDFVLTETASIAQATITGLVQRGTPLADISNVEVEIYHIFPKDSADPPSGNVPARANSPADVEIDTATRDSSMGTLTFTATLLDESLSVQNTVAHNIKLPDAVPGGEGPANGEAVQIAITFTPPIVLPADHYFFRPEVQVDGGFLYLSAPKPIVAPGTPFTGELQAWIRNSDLKPDWLRIGTDIIGGTPAQTFNMAFSLAGETTGLGETPTPTATPRPTATPTDPVSNNGSGDCSIGSAPSANHRTLWFLLAPVAVLWWTRRQRG
ncbi:MAG TPA: PEP-CTERM sorting domain-containing protein [Candidatus Margulisiibacteriota bacterium]|nr:PEP-CTERM sorting domain-containing protein [Candidatus Margulisiibacteriota bacterium]